MTLDEALKRIEELEAENRFLKQMQRDLVKDVDDEKIGKMVAGNLILKGNGSYRIEDYNGNTIMEHDAIIGDYYIHK